MFESLGLFRSIDCPGGSNCSLLNCIFSHNEAGAISVPAPIPNNVPLTTEVSKPQDVEPLRKKRRIETADEGDSESTRPSRPASIVKEGPKTTAMSEVSMEESTRGPPAKEPSPNTRNLLSTVRKVSPPPIRKLSNTAEEKATLTGLKTSTTPPTPKATLENRASFPRQAKKESLNPRSLVKAPASHVVRMSILVKLHDAMVRLNDQIVKKGDPSKKGLILSPDELVTMALDEEEKAAKENPGIYANVIKLRIAKLRKMGIEEWEKDVVAYLGPKYMPAGAKPAQKPEEVLSTGLSSKQEIALVSKLVTRLQGREEFGYVTVPPSEEDMSNARKGVEASQGWEKCDRCSGRFEVFPGRREDGILASGGTCTYHYAKLFRPKKKKTDHITGHTEAYFPCCNETVGTSSGCTKAENHIFKVSEVKRLAAVLQFEETPRQPDKGAQPPICFDCEMGYTTLGMELIRLTAVTWPQGKELLDILVRPIGEILDLNSRFSGVRPEHFVNAVPYGTPQEDDPEVEEGEVPVRPLQVVDSPAAARELLFQCIQPETPLIGHAIDNDLNACRIIHPTVIDTVLLYPHPAGLPIRFSLKVLTKKYLERDIQTGGALGHDSKEDAKAAGDLVRVKLREMWKVMKKQGWEFKDGKLIGPEDGDSGSAATAGVGGGGGASTVLGVGAGRKRKSSDEA